MAFEARAIITSLAKQYIAEGWAFGVSYQVKYFEISAGGHDPNDPTTALAVDPAATSIPGTTLFGPEVIDSVEFETAQCPVFSCVLEQGEYTGELSSVGLIAEVLSAGTGHPDPPTVGAYFLFALYNRPRVSLASTDGPTTFKLHPFM